MMNDRLSSIVWFRQDLRIEDNPALWEAVTWGAPIIPIYIWSPEEEAEWCPGSASRWWLHHSLSALSKELGALGAPLMIYQGKAEEVLTRLCRDVGASAVFWNRRYEPAIIMRDAEIKAALAEKGVTCYSYNGSLLVEPWEIGTKQGKPYQVFTPFWKSLQKGYKHHDPLPAPPRIIGCGGELKSESIDSLGLLPEKNWDKGFYSVWKPGERGAKERLDSFRNEGFGTYERGRDFPADESVSRLSPHLHFGEISPCMIWDAFHANNSAEPFLRQIAWRDFAYHLLVHFPHTPKKPLKEQFRHFPWEKNPDALVRWQNGVTGYPIVDAGMRQLWQTGWMHNRMRMIVGSFLVKDLMISWTEGAQWFWDTLVDADLANNTFGWQWIGGCGADAAPYFRVFNPILQGEKFDPDGEYVRQWVPELKDVPNKWIHKPWEAPGKILYPSPIVDHAKARQQALNSYKSI